jgi:hypothetical protein
VSVVVCGVTKTKKGKVMRQNTIIEVDGRFYHPEEFAAPYGWSRHNGDRVTLVGREGLWVEIFHDQQPFTFTMLVNSLIVVTSGFMNPDFNDGRVTFSVPFLLYATDAEFKAQMKSLGLPSCTRDNLRKDFRDFWKGEAEDAV